jgi:PEGA domain
VVAIAIAVLLLQTGTAIAQAPATADRIAVIDLSRGSPAERRARRDAVEKQLATMPGVRLVDEAGLRRALGGAGADTDLAAGRRALAGAQAAFGALECARARAFADAAVLRLAAAQAAGGDVAAELRRAHAIRLVCADQAKDRGTAQNAATALRRLKAGDPPTGVSDAVWSRYPALDAATGVQNGRLSITSRPAGAAIWIDHAPVGKAPITVSLAEGKHVVAAATAAGATAARHTVVPSWMPGSLALTVPAGRSRGRAVDTRLRAWQSGRERPDGRGVGQVLAAADLTYAVLVGPRGELQVWHRAAGRSAARQLGSAGRAEEIGPLLASAQRGPGIDPSQPLLRESPAQRESPREGSKWQEWWVYAAVIGAVAVGAGVVLANDLGDDQQRIEIASP